MEMIDAESVAEGLAIIAEGLDRLEGASDTPDQRLLIIPIRRTVQAMLELVGVPEAMTWSQDPRWASLFQEAR